MKSKINRKICDVMRAKFLFYRTRKEIILHNYTLESLTPNRVLQYTMKPLIFFSLLIMALTPMFLNDARAQNAPGAPGGARAFKDLLKDIPAKDILKLWGTKKVETSMAMSEQIKAREIGKEGTFRGKVQTIESWPYPALSIVGWRIGIEDSFKRGGDVIIVSTLVYIHTDPNGVMPKIKEGKEVTITGKVTRADLTVTGAPKLNIDMTVPVMTVQK